MSVQKHKPGCSCYRCKITAEANYAKFRTWLTFGFDQLLVGAITDEARFWADFERVNVDAK